MSEVMRPVTNYLQQAARYVINECTDICEQYAPIVYDVITDCARITRTTLRELSQVISTNLLVSVSQSLEQYIKS